MHAWRGESGRGGARSSRGRHPDERGAQGGQGVFSGRRHRGALRRRLPDPWRRRSTRASTTRACSPAHSTPCIAG